MVPMTRGMRKLFQTWSHGRGQKLEVSRRSDNERRTYLFYGSKGQDPRSFELVHHRLNRTVGTREKGTCERNRISF